MEYTTTDTQHKFTNSPETNDALQLFESSHTYELKLNKEEICLIIPPLKWFIPHETRRGQRATFATFALIQATHSTTRCFSGAVEIICTFATMQMQSELLTPHRTVSRGLVEPGFVRRFVNGTRAYPSMLLRLISALRPPVEDGIYIPGERLQMYECSCIHAWCANHICTRNTDYHLLQNKGSDSFSWRRFTDVRTFTR